MATARNVVGPVGSAPMLRGWVGSRPVRQWENGAPTREGHDVFMYGECWILAWYLHRIGGWPVYWVAPISEFGWWEHVFVKIDGKPFDVRGFFVLKKDGYTASHGYTTHRVEPGGTFKEYVDALGGVVPEDFINHDQALGAVRRWGRVMARRLADAHELV